MDLLRHWRRSTFGAAAGGLLVPGAILVAALAVGLGGGGLRGLGSLGQALTGPNLPEVAPLSQRQPTKDAGKLLARVRARASRSRVTAPRTAVRRTSASAPAGGGGPIATTRPPQTTTGTTAPAGGSAPVTAPPPAAAPAATPPPRSPVRQIGDTVTSVTDQVPVVGPTTSQVVDDLVDTVDRILPPR